VNVPADPPHYEKLVCDVCGRFLQWLPKPDRAQAPRNGGHKEIASMAHACFLCGLTREQLKAIRRFIVGHHVFEYHRDEVKSAPVRDDGAWPLCNSCHDYVHLVRKHHGNPEGPPLPVAKGEAA